MSSSSKAAKPDVVLYGDHELITPDTKHLRKMLRPAAADEPDPVARAEAALAQIATEFDIWMNKECERLDAARRKVKDRGLSRETKQELFLAASAGCSSTRLISPRSRSRSSISMSTRCAPSCASMDAKTSARSPRHLPANSGP